jgi:flavodoxin
MKCLVVYFSKSGNTAGAAVKLAELLGADQEEIKETRGRRGPIGFLKSGYESAKKKSPPITQPRKDPGNYDLVIIGTPVWAGTFASPVRSYLEQYGDRIGKAAFLCTQGGDKESQTFSDMADMLGKKPEATLTLRAHVVKDREKFEAEALPLIQDFVGSLKK